MRGDVHVLKAPRNATGSEQRSRRFAVVVQSDLLRLSTLLVAPTSTSARPSKFRPVVSVQGLASTVMIDQTTAVDPTRLGPVVGHLSPDEMVQVATALQLALGLDLMGS